MKKVLAISLLALSFVALSGCASYSSETTQEQTTEEQVAETIPGAENIEIRFERLNFPNTGIYCADSTAYLAFGAAVVLAPQYDSLCAGER